MSTKIGRTEYVTATEAATMLGIERDTFTSYISRGRGPAVALEVAGRKLYKLADVVKYRDNRPGAGARTDLTKKGRKR